MTLLLVDGTNVVMRYAAAMTADHRDPTEPEIEAVIEAVLHAILDCAHTVMATHLIVALDSGLPSWRKELFEGYKAKREPGITNRWSNALNVYLNLNGVLVIREPGHEADDLIATLVARAGRAGIPANVLSGDSDLLQLASLACAVYQFGQQKNGEPRFAARSMEWIRAKYDLVSAGQLAMYKALVGEPGDGLPGVSKVGPMKARELLHLAAIPADVRHLLGSAEKQQQFDLMLKLVTLKADVDITPIKPSECSIARVRAAMGGSHAQA